MWGIAIVKKALWNSSASKMLDLSVGAWGIVLGVKASFEGWGVIFQQEDHNMERHPCRNDSGQWTEAGMRYDAGKRECHGLLQALKKFHNYVYGVRFLVETDANTLVHRLNLHTNDLPGAPVTRWIVRIGLFGFDLKNLPGRHIGGTGGLSQRPWGEGVPDPEQEDDLEETIIASLWGI